MISRREPALPTFFVIGAAKCGTTSLHAYLHRHPEIGMSRVKEPRYFSRADLSARDLRTYMALFDARFRVRGESSVGYSVAPHRDGVPGRIRATVPDARIVYLVRDPVERFVTDHVHRTARGRENRSLAKAARSAAGSWPGDRGRYAFQLAPYLDRFDRHRVHVIVSERLDKYRRDTLARLFAFLDVDPDVWDPAFEHRHHESRHHRRKGAFGLMLQRVGNSGVASLFPADARHRVGRVLYGPFSRPIERPTLDPETRAILVDFYRDDVAELRALLDDPLPEWSL
ncbi:MAG: sulfotransferase [Gemmatimonadota bacterium]|nr:sulfotransferase [Gemmatimonadota bacterium]